MSVQQSERLGEPGMQVERNVVAMNPFKARAEDGGWGRHYTPNVATEDDKNFRVHLPPKLQANASESNSDLENL